MIKAEIIEEFISYGIVFDKKKFNKATNYVSILNKPRGGLWSSPVMSDFGWKDWCEAETFRTENFNTWTKFKLSPGTKILVIDSKEDFLEILYKYGTEPVPVFGLCLDFDKIMSDGWEGIYLTEKGNRECHLIMEVFIISDLNAWDCESMVLFDCDKIEITEIHEGT